MVEDKNGDWELKDVVILKQEISSGNTVLQQEALSIYYSKVGKKMGNTNFRFCWWHSHHTMSAFWSGTDITAIDEFNEGDFSFALVVNLKGEYKFRVSVWKPVEVHQDIDLEIIDQKNKCTKKMKSEVEDLCSTDTSISKWKKSNYGNIYRYNYKSNPYLLKEAEEDPRQEKLSFISSNGPKTYIEIVEEVDSFNDDLTDGTIKYNAYKDAIEDLNKELEEEKSLYKVNLIKESQKDDLLYILPAQLVVYAATGDEVDDVYSDYGYGGYIQ